jgi:4-methyl-5(b-hydroxyethyl)-thiazole monophosphate biosynthesis
MTPRAVIILAEGFEEIEAITPIDLLRRAGIEVIIAGLNATDVRGSHDIVVRADCLLSQVGDDFTAIILPGGPGAAFLAESQPVLDFVKKAYAASKLCAAICAAPVVLAKAGLLAGRKATCYPGREPELTGATFVERTTVIDGNVITSRGAGTSVPFALEVIRYMAGATAADKVGTAILHGVRR